MTSPKHAAPGSRHNAHRLRRDMTDAEKRLWAKLRANQLSGHHFRRQVAIGHFIADFCCPKAMLIIEIDGGQHAENVRDMERTAWLESQGYRVMRFWNNDVLQNLDGALQMIAAGLPAKPPTPPSP